MTVGKGPYYEWPVKRRMEALRLMDEYLAKNARASYYITWERTGAPKKATLEETLAYREEVASDLDRFNHALFSFYCCLTTDMSFLLPK